MHCMLYENESLAWNVGLTVNVNDIEESLSVQCRQKHAASRGFLATATALVANTRTRAIRSL